MMALQAAQMYYAMQGYLTVARIDIETKMMELTIHFEMNKFPTIPEWLEWFTYSEREITSHTSYFETIKEVCQVRCMCLYYRW